MHSRLHHANQSGCGESNETIQMQSDSMFDAKFEFNLEVARQGRHTWPIPTDWTRSHPAYAETSTRLGIIIL